LRPVIELSRAGAFVRCHRLRVLKRAAVAEIGGDAGCTERVVAYRRVDAGRNSAPADHAPGIRLRHRLFGQSRSCVPRAGAKQPAFAVFGDAGGIDEGAQRLGKRVMAWHRVLLAAFLVQLNLPAGALRPKILDLHAQRGGDAGEGVGEGGDQCAIA
jgi:hypothetical protein